MADESDFDLAFKQIMEADAKENSPDAKPAVIPSVSAADNAPPAGQQPAPQPTGQQAEPPKVEDKTEFEMPAKTAEELAAEAEAALAVAQTPEARTAAEALKAEADAAVAKAAADKAAADAAAAQPTPTQDFMKQFAETLRDTIKPQPQPQPQQQQQQPQLMTDEEAAFLTQYDQDYPDIARAEFIRRRVEYNQLLQYAFGEIARSIMPIAQTVQTMAERMHLGDIQSHVPDYNTVRSEVVAWVDKQPAYLKHAYTQVVTSGTQEEVVDLINRWRADTGKALPNGAANGHQPPARKPAKTPTPEAQAAAAALAPVATKRTGAVAAEPATFDDAFAEFSKVPM